MYEFELVLYVRRERAFVGRFDNEKGEGDDVQYRRA